MSWLFIVIGTIVIFIIIFFVRSQYKLYILGAEGSVGRCPSCGKLLKMREKMKTIRISKGPKFGLEKEVFVTELYCSKCNKIINGDRFHAIDRAHEEY